MGASTAARGEIERDVEFVALGRQNAQISDELQRAFRRVVDGNAFILGEEVERFEAEFAEYSGVSHCVGVSSGTAALSLALRAAGVGPGDEVIVPGHTFISSALGAVHAGATPILCDVDAATGLIDPAAARAAIGPRTAAIVAVHLYGQVCDIDALAAISRSHGLFLLEDAAQAHGARLRRCPAGSLGDAAGFSFYPSKNLGALGDGGAITTNNDVLAARLRRLRNLGQRRKGEHVEVGFNERLDGLQAAFLRAKLPHLDAANAARRGHAAAYRRLLGPTVRLLGERPESECVYHLFPIRCAERDALASALARQGIQSGVHYSPALPDHPALRGVARCGGDLAVAEAWAAEELSLPMHPHLTTDEIERVAQAVNDATRDTLPQTGEVRC